MKSRLVNNRVSEATRESWRARKQLKQYGFTSKSTLLELSLVLLILAFVSLVIWIIVRDFNLQRVPWSQAFTAVLSLGIAIIAYRQWGGARHEISIDKYYDRLEVANRRLELVQNNKPSAEDMHAFAELDKLEYVITKYEYGYISAVLALRALENFKGLCRDRDGFSELASRWVKRAAYRKVTKEIVNKVCDECRSGSGSE